MTRARSAAEIPAVAPSRASIRAPACSARELPLSFEWASGMPSSRIRLSVIATETMPRASRARKLTWSGVIFSAAITRSPSASSCSSATITTMRPSRMRAKTSSSDWVAIPGCPWPRYYHCQFYVTSAGQSVRSCDRTPLDERVATDPPHRDIGEADRLAHTICFEALHGGQPRAQHLGCDEERNSIDYPGTESGAGQMRASLEQDFAPSAACKF